MGVALTTGTSPKVSYDSTKQSVKVKQWSDSLVLSGSPSADNKDFTLTFKFDITGPYQASTAGPMQTSSSTLTLKVKNPCTDVKFVSIT